MHAFIQINDEYSKLYFQMQWNNLHGITNLSFSTHPSKGIDSDMLTNRSNLIYPHEIVYEKDNYV